MTSSLTRSLGASVVAALAAVVIIAPPASATPGTTTVGDYVYSYDDADVAAGATITDYLGSDTDLTIPGTVTIGPHTYSVTAIGDSAFEVNALTSVTIPGAVTTIGDSAFERNSLTSVTIPGSVTAIGAEAFYFNDLTSVIIPSSVTSIGNGAFQLNALTSVTIPDSVTTIGAYTFFNNDLTAVTIPGSVTTIGDEAFAYNYLTAVTIPDSVTAIGDRAFEVNDLTSVTIGASVTTIGGWAFDGNPLGSVLMLGPAPSTGSLPFGTAGASTPLVSFFYRFILSGYTTPTWATGGQAYRSAALASFTDVPTGSPFFDEIGWLAQTGITTGYADGTFRPSADVERQAMAAFLYRFAGEPVFTPPATPTFTDVPVGAPFFREVEWLASTGITTGWPDGTFRPVARVQRQAMAAFLYRFAGEPAFTPPATPTFTDVPAGAPFFLEVEWLSSTGITTGWPDHTFRPSAYVQRQAMAAFLMRFDTWEGQ